MKVGFTRLALTAFALAQALLKIWSFSIVLLLLGSPVLHGADLSPNLNAPLVLPFRLVGNTMFIEASINGQVGEFLFDTGAPDLILNSAYFNGFNEGREQAEVVGLYGEVLSLQHFLAKEVVLNGTIVAGGNAFVLDLTSLEKIKKMPIAGILGYAVLKNYELQIDFDCQLITLFLLKKNSETVPAGHDSPTDSFDFKMSGHIPYLNVRLGNKTIRMGIDSGSERNVLQTEALGTQPFEQRGILRLAGLTQQERRQPIGLVKGVGIGHWELEALEVVLTDFGGASDELPVRLHGILGVEFLKQHKVSINYKRKKIYLWRSAGAVNEPKLAMCKP